MTRSIHLHTQVHRFTLLASQSDSAHRNLWLPPCNSRLIHLAVMLCLHVNSSQRSRSKLFQCLLVIWWTSYVLRYLFFGYIELTSDGLCQLQSTLRTRKHGSEAVESLNQKKQHKTQQSVQKHWPDAKRCLAPVAQRSRLSTQTMNMLLLFLLFNMKWQESLIFENVLMLTDYIAFHPKSPFVIK